MGHVIDPRRTNNLIDANALHRTGGPQDAALDKILHHVANDELPLVLPYSVQNELKHPNTPQDVKQRAMGLIFSIEVELTPHERQQHADVQAILKGNAKSGKHDWDAFHVVESAKYGGYFLTNDKRILSKRGEIAAVLPGQRIVTPEEFLQTYEKFEAECPERRHP